VFEINILLSFKF